MTAKVSQEEFAHVFNEYISLKKENEQLRDDLKKATPAPTSKTNTLFAFFTPDLNSDLDGAQKEADQLKKSLAQYQEQNRTLNEQLQKLGCSGTDPLPNVDSLFQTKERELQRMKELNEVTLKDLQEELDLATELYTSLENGYHSLEHDKEVIESSITAFRNSRTSIESRSVTLRAINQGLRDDLNIKSADEASSSDLATQVLETRQELQDLQEKLSLLDNTITKERARLLTIEKTQKMECEQREADHHASHQESERKIKSLTKELKSLGSSPKRSEPVQIEVDRLVQENQQLKDKMANLEVEVQRLIEKRTRNQNDCKFLQDWIQMPSSPARRERDSLFQQKLRAL